MRSRFSTGALPHGHSARGLVRPGIRSGAPARDGTKALLTGIGHIAFLPRRLLCCAVLFGAASSVTLATGDRYLEMLDEEVTKVEAAPTDTAVDGGVSSASADPARFAQPALSQKSFEALLKRQQLGTYSFYRRLPERSRKEIFADYSDGASIETLREKIIDRYLHP